jgi:hypothetical protein
MNVLIIIKYIFLKNQLFFSSGIAKKIENELFVIFSIFFEKRYF